MKALRRISSWVERNLEEPLCQAEILRYEMAIDAVGKNATTERGIKRHGKVIVLRPAK